MAIEITTFCQLTKAYHQGIPGTPRNSGQNRLDAPQVVVRNLCGFWRSLPSAWLSPIVFCKNRLEYSARRSRYEAGALDDTRRGALDALKWQG